MALCCIGGVCVPYTALLPILVLGLQWILQKLSQAGLLPSTWSTEINKYLGASGQHQDKNHLRRGKQSKVGSCCAPNKTIVNCTKDEEWETLVRSTTAPAIAVKFTATWCKPCKKIHPVFEAFVADCTNVQFATVDADELDELASKFQVVSLPTFLLLDSRTQMIIGDPYSGSDEAQLKNWWETASQLAKKMS